VSSGKIRLSPGQKTKYSGFQSVWCYRTGCYTTFDTVQGPQLFVQTVPFPLLSGQQLYHTMINQHGITREKKLIMIKSLAFNTSSNQLLKTSKMTPYSGHVSIFLLCSKSFRAVYFQIKPTYIWDMIMWVTVTTPWCVLGLRICGDGLQIWRVPRIYIE